MAKRQNKKAKTPYRPFDMVKSEILRLEKLLDSVNGKEKENVEEILEILRKK